MRKHRSARERERLFLLHDKRCHLCSQPIQPGDAWQLEHVVPWELTRDEGDDNVRPAHTGCHKVKTAADIRGIRKTDRQRQKHNGSWPKSRRPMRGRGFQKIAAKEEKESENA
jgi:5-methylcytosine-specific restriction endonuclease McrA